MITKISRWLETDFHYVLKGSFWLTTARVVTSGSSFVLAIAFAHLLSKQDYGVYKYVLSMVAALSALSLTGLNTSIVQSVARGFEHIARTSLWTNIKWSIGMIVVTIGIAVYYATQGNFTLALSFATAALFAPILNGALLYRSYLNGKKSFKALAWHNSLSALIPAIIIILGLLVTANPWILILIYFVGNTATALIIYFYILRKYQPNNKIDENTNRYSQHLSGIYILDTIATNLDKVLLFQHLGGVSLAVYSFAIAIPEQLRALLGIIPTLAIPKLAEKSDKDIQRVIYRKITKLFLITIPIIIIYFFAAPLLYRLLFPQYLESIQYSRFFALIMLVEGGLAGAVFKAKMAIKEQYILNVSSNIIKIGLLWGLMLIYGIWGIIAARIISRFISFGLALFLLKRWREPSEPRPINTI